MKHTLLLIVGAAIATLLTLFGVASLWRELGVKMTMHGWIAYGLGAVVSLALASGLFWLTFKSAREGFDDIERPEDE